MASSWPCQLAQKALALLPHAPAVGQAGTSRGRAVTPARASPAATGVRERNAGSPPLQEDSFFLRVSFYFKYRNCEKQHGLRVKPDWTLASANVCYQGASLSLISSP